MEECIARVTVRKGRERIGRFICVAPADLRRFGEDSRGNDLASRFVKAGT
jgi:hypothetical protein